jgi:hypothetical protein
MGVDEYRDREGDAEERTGLGQGERVAKTSRTPAQPIAVTATPTATRRSARGWPAIPRASTPASATPPPKAATPPAADQPAPESRAGDNRGGDGADHCSPFRRAQSVS